jgi:hypothetical protein
MATYKVIQDIEAEDKFVGPLTLKQFVFACAGILFGYLNIFALTKGLPVLMAVFVPPMALGFFLAVPWSRDQPTEMWVLAKLKFLFKPKIRIWDQSGVQELVTITAPKKIEKNLTKNYTPGEVKSRLKALAETIDSRGWATKHATLEDSRFVGGDFVSDRLVSPSALPRQVPAVDLESVPDVMDPSSNPLSDNLQTMIKAQDNKYKDELRQKMDKARRGEPPEPANRDNMSINKNHKRPAVPAPAAKKYRADEKLINKQLQAKKQVGELAKSHMRGLSINHPGQTGPAARDSRLEAQSSNAMTSEPAPDTISRLASSNDLNIATVAREANRGGEDNGEIVVPLR